MISFVVGLVLGFGLAIAYPDIRDLALDFIAWRRQHGRGVAGKAVQRKDYIL